MNFSEQNNQQIGALQADVTNLKADFAEVKDDVREVRDILLQARGSWKMLVIIAGFSSAITVMLSKLIAWLPNLPK